MPRVGFEPATPVFERAKTVHALDRAVTNIEDIMSRWADISVISSCPSFGNPPPQLQHRVVSLARVRIPQQKDIRSPLYLLAVCIFS
jgi:hypothetical protein